MNEHVVKTFTYPLEDADIVAKAKERAHRNGLSFSAYVMELLREENKKNEEPHTDPINLLGSTRPADIAMQFDILNLSQKGISEYLNLLCNDNEIKQLKILRDKEDRPIK
jgi:hypothetical protein